MKTLTFDANLAETIKLVTAGQAEWAKQLQRTVQPFAEAMEQVRALNTPWSTEDHQISKAARQFDLTSAQWARQLQETMRPFVEAMERVQAPVREAIAKYSQHIEEVQQTLKAVAPHLQSFSSIAKAVLEEQRVAGLIEKLGFVPHAELWAHIAGVEAPSEQEGKAFSESLAATTWPRLKSQVELDVEMCLGDARLQAIYDQALKAHEAGLYELVISATMTIIERAVFLARKRGDKRKIFEWLDEEVKMLPASMVGGYRGFSTWQVLVTKVFAGCWSDADADALTYPNRHATAHGLRSRLAGPIDSLNAILLGHFAIQVASVVVNHRATEEEARSQNQDAE